MYFVGKTFGLVVAGKAKEGLCNISNGFVSLRCTVESCEFIAQHMQLIHMNEMKL